MGPLTPSPSGGRDPITSPPAHRRGSLHLTPSPSGGVPHLTPSPSGGVPHPTHDPSRASSHPLTSHQASGGWGGLSPHCMYDPSRPPRPLPLHAQPLGGVSSPRSPRGGPRTHPRTRPPRTRLGRRRRTDVAAGAEPGALRAPQRSQSPPASAPRARRAGPATSRDGLAPPRADWEAAA